MRRDQKQKPPAGSRGGAIVGARDNLVKRQSSIVS